MLSAIAETLPPDKEDTLPNDYEPATSNSQKSNIPESPPPTSDAFNRRQQRRFQSLNTLRNAFHTLSIDSSNGTSTEENCWDIEEDVILPEENRWMIACCTGNIDDIKDLLKTFPRLLNHRDFIFGYTALHWLSKQGHIDGVEFIASKCTSMDYLDLDVKSHGGFTPLHLASMCGQEEVIVRLVELGANIHARDNNGKKPKDLVKNTVAATVQNKIGKPLVLDGNVVLESGLSLKGRHGTRSKRSSFVQQDGTSKDSPVVDRRSVKSAGASLFYFNDH